MPRAWLDYFATTAQIAQTALRLWQPPQMSFRGVKRRGNPINRNATQWRLPLTALVLAITTAQKIFAISSSRDKNSCHNFSRLSAWCARLWRKRINENLFRAFLYTECAYSGCEPQRRREIGAPSFRRTQAPFASTTTSCSCSPWFFVLLFPHDKNFAFIFDMQALVRLFLPCGSPCVRSTSDCAVLLRSRRTKRSGTAFSRFVLQMLRMPFVACNELAIATKSIASVLPHAEWTPWVPF